jgi:hypothetical protein
MVVTETHVPDELRRILRHLVELQRIDAERSQVQARLDAAPGKIDAVRAALAKSERGWEATEEERRALGEKRKECERVIRECEEKIRALEARLYSVKSQREYDAGQEETQSLRRRISAQEDVELAIMEEEERLAPTNEKTVAAREAQRADAEREIARLEALRREDEATLEALNRDRGRFTGELPQRLLDRYEALVSRHPTSAVVRATPEGTCGGCQLQLVHQTMIDVEECKKITACRHCSRLLVPADLEGRVEKEE